ncbi:hypothetical protein DES40_1495 [Litorimonas taeanensis]|uniref:Uncharacterized protein n=2 Tax=Litorimonas taeanensis TaxID=568099 RepID=A0A420WM90_9PROT|nr:hypothetical protein DES40_1495 [Litorimonas taeanensis]
MIQSAAPRNMFLKGLKCQASSVAFLLSCTIGTMGLLSPSALADDVDKKNPPSTIEDDLSNAADSLSAVIGSAKQSGILKSHSNKAVTTPVPAGERQNTPQPLNVKSGSCQALSVLDFSNLKTLSNYEDLSAAKTSEPQENKAGNSQHIARVYISLGLGIEAATAISNDSSEEANLLRHVAMILAEPNTARYTGVFKPYQNCVDTIFPFVALDTPEVLANDIDGARRRAIINSLDKYPPKLKDFLEVHLAIRAFENGRNNLGNAIWSKLEREARENETALPEERYDEDELLYLKALLEVNGDTDYARSIFSHLAEREGLYRLSSLQQLTDLKLKSISGSKSGGSSVRGSTAIEVDLLEMSEKGIGSRDGQIAAFELVKNRVYSNNVTAAVNVTKKYFHPSDDQYKASAEKIRSLIQARLISDNNLVRLQGLNGFLSERDFYAVTDNFPALEYDALYAAFESGLPELHSSIISEASSMPEKTDQLLRSSKLFEAIKHGQTSLKDIESEIKTLSEPMVLRIAQYAIAENDIALMRIVEANLASETEAQTLSRSIAFAEKRWGDITATESSPETTSQVKTANLLSRDIQNPVTTKSKNWLSSLPSQLKDIDTSIRQTKDFLNNG